MCTKGVESMAKTIILLSFNTYMEACNWGHFETTISKSRSVWLRSCEKNLEFILILSKAMPLLLQLETMT